VRAGPARRRRDARLGGMQRGMTICESDSNIGRAEAPEEARRVWPRRRDRRREKSAHTITCSRLWVLSFLLGTVSVPTLSLSSLWASCRLTFAALTTHSLKLAARCSRACPDRSSRPRQQNQPALVLLAQKRSRGRVRSRLGPATLVAHSFASLPARRLQSHGDPRASRPSAASKVDVLTASASRSSRPSIRGMKRYSSVICALIDIVHVRVLPALHARRR
jgi:hypothetical protein